jgi:FdhE protein
MQTPSTDASSRRLLSAEEIALRAGQPVPFVRLLERGSVFAEREMRLRQLAASHPMRDFLLFMAEVAKAQQRSLDNHPALQLPDGQAIERAARLGAPPLPATEWPRDPAWRAGFRQLRERLLPHLPTAAQARLQTPWADDDWLEQQADRLLGGIMLGLDLATAPLIAAALQVQWTHLALATQAAHGAGQAAVFGRTDAATLCPCCASRPTASVSRIGADAAGYRYLHCSLCSLQWHMVRIKCSHCESSQGIHYQSLQAADAPPASPPAGRSPSAHATVQAETCDACGHYLKIVHMGRDPHAEPVADDLASVTLDLLVTEAGFQRHGLNLMLLYGEGVVDSDPEPGGPGDP